jgi:hypothetical protein
MSDQDATQPGSIKRFSTMSLSSSKRFSSQFKKAVTNILAESNNYQQLVVNSIQQNHPLNSVAASMLDSGVTKEFIYKPKVVEQDESFHFVEQ